MRLLGAWLAGAILQIEPTVRAAPVCLACSAEDADFLVRGFLDQFHSAGVLTEKLKMACFWNERIRRFEGDQGDSLDIVPVVKQYREIFDVEGSLLIVVSSIISTARVLQASLATLLHDRRRPAAAIVAAPVML